MQSTRKNTDRVYAVNSLDVNVSWDESNGINTLATDFSDIDQTVNQHLDNPAFSISDKADLIFNTGNNAWNVSFGAGWNHRPQKLSVSPASIFPDKAEKDIVSQNYTSDDFRGQAETGYFIRFGELRINTFIFGNVDIESVKSDLDGFDLSDLKLSTDTHSEKLKVAEKHVSAILKAIHILSLLYRFRITDNGLVIRKPAIGTENGTISTSTLR